MIKTLEELDTEAADVLQTFAAIETAALSLEARIAAAASRMASNRADIDAALGALQQEILELADSVEDFEMVASVSLDKFDTAMHEMGETLAGDTAESAKAVADAESKFEESASALLTIAAETGEVHAIYSTAAARRETDLTTWSSETQTLGKMAAARVEEVREGIHALHTATSALAAELDDHIDGKRRELETWHDDFLADAAQSVTELAQRIAEAGASQVQAPMTNYIDGLNAELYASATALLNRVLAGVEDGLRKIEVEIVEAAGGTEQKRAEMAPVREALDAVKEPIDAVLGTVRNTASIVGFSV